MNSSEMNQPTQTTQEAQGSPYEKKHYLLMLLTVLFGLLFDILFHDGTIGISIPICLSAYYGMMLWYERKSLLIRLDFGWFLSLPVFLLSLTYAFFSNPALSFFNLPALLVLVVLQSLLITGSNIYPWHDIRILKDGLYAVFSRPFAYIRKAFSVMGSLLPRRKGPGHETARKVLLGLVIGLPLLLIILSLLASADRVFELYLNKIPNIFEGFRLDEAIAHAFLFLFGFLLSFSFIWSLSARRKGNRLAYDQKGPDKKGLDPVAWITVLTMVDLVYVFFVAIQFSYLFGGLETGLPDAFTYSEYARRGFFELVMVAMINFGILWIYFGFIKEKGGKAWRMTRILNTLLVACTLVMLFSAHFRMSLYEQAYGYTYLRMFTHLFMGFLLILLLMALYRVWKESFDLVKPTVIVTILAYLLVNYMNVDATIARLNVNRYFETGKVDVGYLSFLSYDAVPELLRLLACDDPETSQQAGNELYWIRERLQEDDRWQSFNLSKYRAWQLIKDLDVKPYAYPSDGEPMLRDY